MDNKKLCSGHLSILPIIFILLELLNCQTRAKLTHWGRVTHICVSKLTIIGSDNDLSPGRRPPIIWTNAGMLLIEPLGRKFSEILIAIYPFLFKKIHLKMSSGKCRPFCIGVNVLRWRVHTIQGYLTAALKFMWILNHVLSQSIAVNCRPCDMDEIRHDCSTLSSVRTKSSFIAKYSMSNMKMTT